MINKILVITPIKHIAGVSETLEQIGEVTFLDDPSAQEVKDIIHKYDAIFTNPNKSKVFIGQEILDRATRLQVICTASTGTNHIDKNYASELSIPVISITEEREIINKISSTAELAFSLTLAGLRHLVNGHNSVLNGEWDYEKFIGRQMNFLTIGIIGYGRLGSIYSKYCRAFDSNVLVYDPYKKIKQSDVKQTDSLNELIKKSDVIAIHVHVTNETIRMINSECFDSMKDDVLIINTSRGDMIDETALVEFLSQNPRAKVATDVLQNEVQKRIESPLLKYSSISNQVTITPHIGGMTREAQEIAYGHAAKLLLDFSKNI